MSNAKQIADAVGRSKMAEALNVVPAAVSNAVRVGTFPASWYLTIKRLAQAKRVSCPDSLFRMAPKGDVE